MTENLSKKTVMIIDNGLFVSFARMLGKSFGKTYYHVPWQTAFPMSSSLSIGKGFDEIERVRYPLDFIDKVDLWIFLDLYQHDLQLFLEKTGHRVFGCRKGEELELDRVGFKNQLKKVGLPIAKTEVVIGIGELREYLKTVKNKYVKTSTARGDFETFRHDTYDISEPRLDELEHTLGGRKHSYQFLVEDEIPDCVEVGYDGVCIDGKWPDKAMMAYEIKDVGMIGRWLPYPALAAPVRAVNTKISSIMNGYKYRGFFSSEIRYGKDKQPYFIDPCCRLGTPSNELLQELFENWPEVVWNGAEGVSTVLRPRPKAKFGVLVMLQSEWCVKNWGSIYYPKEIDQFVKLRFHSRVDGKKNYVSPQTVGLPDIGGVVGTGDTLEAAIAQVRERAKQIKAYQLHVNDESIEKGLEVIAKGEKAGIKFFMDGEPRPRS